MSLFYLSRQVLRRFTLVKRTLIATAILVAYRHGLRASELVALRWDDIDLATGRVCGVLVTVTSVPRSLYRGEMHAGSMM